MCVCVCVCVCVCFINQLYIKSYKNAILKAVALYKHVTSDENIYIHFNKPETSREKKTIRSTIIKTLFK